MDEYLRGLRETISKLKGQEKKDFLKDFDDIEKNQRIFITINKLMKQIETFFKNDCMEITVEDDYLKIIMSKLNFHSNIIDFYHGLNIKNWFELSIHPVNNKSLALIFTLKKDKIKQIQEMLL